MFDVDNSTVWHNQITVAPFGLPLFATMTAAGPIAQYPPTTPSPPSPAIAPSTAAAPACRITDPIIFIFINIRVSHSDGFPWLGTQHPVVLRAPGLADRVEIWPSNRPSALHQKANPRGAWLAKAL